MSIIAAKKAMQKKGKESILLIAGIVCTIPSLILILLVYALKWELTRAIMIPIMYFFLLAGINIGIGSFIREIREDKDAVNEKLRNYLAALIACGIVGAGILGAFNW